MGTHRLRKSETNTNGFDKMSYELQTDRLIDEMYDDGYFCCDECKQYTDEYPLETSCDKRLQFCSVICLKEWENENKWEYEEDEG